MKTPQWNDTYYFGDYKYIYYANSGGWKVELNPSVVNQNQTTYGQILHEINGKKVTSLYKTFADCTKLTVVPDIPSSVIHMHGTFMNCTSLIDARNIIIPSGIYNMGSFNAGNPGTFENCTNLKYAPQIPPSITEMDATFKNCTSLLEMPTIPNRFNKSNIFAGCTQFGY